MKKKGVKVVNGKTYYLSVCESCLVKEYPIYSMKNPSRVFNTCNEITKFAFQIDSEDFEKQRKKSAQSLNAYIAKYGEEEGEKRWQHYTRKLSEKNTLQYHIDKWGEEKGRRKWEEYSKSRAATLENFIRRFGEEEGKIKWKNYCQRQSYTETLEYCLEKFGEKGHSEFLSRNRNKALSKEKFLEKYGEEEGEKRWIDYRRKYIESFSKRSKHSKKAHLFFSELRKKISDLNLTIFDSHSNERYFIVEGKVYFVDFYIKELDIAIEYLGDFWHANPAIYHGDSILFAGMKANEIRKRDEDRLSKINCKRIICVWEQNADNTKIEELETIIRDEFRNREN